MKTQQIIAFIFLIFIGNFNSIYAQNDWTVYTRSNSGICSDTIMSIYIDNDDNFWFGGVNGVSKFDGNNWTSYTSNNSEFRDFGGVRAITQWNGHYYFGCETGIQIFNGTYWDYIGGTLAQGITSMDKDNEGNLWFGTSVNGVIKYDGYTPFNYNSLPSSRIEDLKKDKNGNIWVAMVPENFPFSYDTAGIAKFNGSSWEIYNTQNSILTNENVSSITKDNNGNLWFGTDSLLLYKFDGSNWERYDLSEEPTSNWLSSLAVDNEGNIWAGLGWFSGERGIIQFDGSNILKYGRDEGFPSENQVYDLEIDKFNNIWIGTQNGLIKLNNGVKTDLSGIDSLRSLSNINLQWIYPFQNNVKIEYTTNNGSTWLLIADNINAQYNLYNWAVPVVAPPSNDCKIRITDITNPSIFIESDSCFTIYAKVETPLITPEGGIKNNGINVTISCSTENSVIYFSTDGSEPDQSSQQFTTSLYLNKNTVVKAKAFKSDWVRSDSATSNYQMKVGDLSFDPSPETYNVPQQVTLNTLTDSAVIHYTLNRTDPSPESPIYNQPITVNENTLIKAIGYRNNFDNSLVASGNYIISEPAITAVIKTDTIWLDSDFNGYEERIVDGSESSITYDTIYAYIWKVNGDSVASGPKPKIKLNSGTSKITLHLLNPQIGSAETSVDINVYSSKLKTNGGIYSAIAQLDNNTFFASSADDKVYQFDSTCFVNWNILTGGSIQSTTCISDQNNIYVGSTDTRLYAFDQEGVPKWDKAMGGIITSSPSAGKDGVVYVGISTGRLYALDATGNIKWNVQTGGAIISSPAVSLTGDVYVGSCDKKLYSINKDGKLNWTFITGDTILSSPAIGNDSCIVFGSNDGYLYKLTPDGNKKWSYFAGGKIKSSPIILNDGEIIFGDSNNEIVCIGIDGDLAWKYITNGPVSGTAAISNGGQILIGDENGALYNLDPLGILLWYFQINSPIVSPILITNNNLAIFGNLNGDVYTLKLDPKQSLYVEPVNYEWPTFKGNNKRTGNKSKVLTGINNNDLNTVTEYKLSQNFPNPFNPSTTIKYQIPKESFVSVKIYDVIGNEVADLVNEQQKPGYYELLFDAGNLSSGVYFYRIISDNFTSVKKMLLLK